MTWNAPLNPRQFTSAVDWFRARVPVLPADVDTTDPVRRSRAFTVAGVQEMRVIQTVQSELQDAIRNGTSLETFKRRVTERLRTIKKKQVPWPQLDTVFRTNTQRAYQAGRYFRLTRPEQTRTRPFLEFVAILDEVTTEICRSRDGTIKRHDAPWVRANWPPLHFNCRSTWVSRTRAQVARAGGPTLDEHDSRTEPGEGFGDSPDLVNEDAIIQPKEQNYDPLVYQEYRSRAWRFFPAHVIAERQGAQ